LPHRIGIAAPVRRADPGLPIDTPLLPQILQSQGYRTAMIGKWHLSHENADEQKPHNRGFDEFYGSFQTGIDYFTHMGPRDSKDWWRNDEIAHEKGYITHLQADEGVKLIQETQDQPLFLFFAPHAPHAPIQAPAKTIAKFAHLDGPNGPTYAAMVAEFDVAVSQLLTAIEQSEQAENTIVVFFSDNGGLRFADVGDFRGRKNTIYEGGIRAPFVIKWAGASAPGARTAQLASAMDLMPTLLTAAGVSSENQPTTDGIDLRSALDGTSTLDRAPLVMGNHQYVLITPEWKLVGHGPEAELYNLIDDPTESTDLASREIALTTKLKNLLKKRIMGLPEFEERQQNRRRRN
ncbi:MAG: sulfatase-like hydrolase/transferase, partial [Opitutaceae bacterium]|nr:sulfatase-like hydrolase/transferase [Opitutaceae bacterium]